MKKKISARIFSVLLSVILSAGQISCGRIEQTVFREEGTQYQEAAVCDSLEDIPEYEGVPYVEINGNQPDFAEEELVQESYEEYSELDELGRCGEAKACIGEDLMPEEEREDVSSVKPTGWINKAYDNVEGEYLYNRCHLIGFQLSGENANEENLITGTRYMNTEGMLPFENLVADYVTETDNHVLYQVTPVFEGDNLVASGVQMQAESVEDNGEGICFNVYVYNVQPYITINYATGESWESDEETDAEIDAEAGQSSNVGEKETEYILNENTHKFHLPDCSGVKDMKDKNKKEYTGTREHLINEGYEPCGICKP